MIIILVYTRIDDIYSIHVPGTGQVSCVFLFFLLSQIVIRLTKFHDFSSKKTVDFVRSTIEEMCALHANTLGSYPLH